MSCFRVEVWREPSRRIEDKTYMFVQSQRYYLEGFLYRMNADVSSWVDIRSGLHRPSKGDAKGMSYGADMGVAAYEYRWINLGGPLNETKLCLRASSIMLSSPASFSAESTLTRMPQRRGCSKLSAPPTRWRLPVINVCIPLPCSPILLAKSSAPSIVFSLVTTASASKSLQMSE